MKLNIANSKVDIYLFVVNNSAYTVYSRVNMNEPHGYSQRNKLSFSGSGQV